LVDLLEEDADSKPLIISSVNESPNWNVTGQLVARIARLVGQQWGTRSF